MQSEIHCRHLNSSYITLDKEILATVQLNISWDISAQYAEFGLTQHSHISYTRWLIISSPPHLAIYLATSDRLVRIYIYTHMHAMATGNLRTSRLANEHFADQACTPGPQNTHLLLLVISLRYFTPTLFNDIELCVFQQYIGPGLMYLFIYINKWKESSRSKYCWLHVFNTLQFTKYDNHTLSGMPTDSLSSSSSSCDFIAIQAYPNNN